MPTFLTSPGGLAADAPGAPRNVILVGLSGAGKSSAGKALADELGRGFLDFDEEIERRAGMSIPALFAERGEGTFRQMEKELTTECQEVAGMVLAPGGGWITGVGLLELLRPPAQVIWLKVRPETAVRRMGEARIVRPLLSRGGNPATVLERMLKEREAAYGKADVSVNTEMYDMQRLVQRLKDVVTS
ncbi:MAG: shikimate kinase [Gemmatimonadetes bacterium]|nr:shikimate kinase [Gemmatimonadota bacterium]